MQAAAVPKNTPIKDGLITVILMDCMAAMPWGAGCRARAFITKDEKAKKTPAISPQPSAENNFNAKSDWLVIAIKPECGLLPNIMSGQSITTKVPEICIQN